MHFPLKFYRNSLIHPISSFFTYADFLKQSSHHRLVGKTFGEEAIE